MKKAILGLILTLSSIILLAQEPTEKTKLLTAHPWLLYKKISSNKEIAKGEVYNFMPDNSLQIVKGDETNNAKWKFDVSESLLIIDGGAPWDIITLNGKEFHAVQISSGVKTDFWFKLKN